MKQLIIAIKILHEKFKVFHGDIKTDNILIKGINEKNEFIISEYIKENFNERYINEKKKYKNITKNKKIKIRQEIHTEITNNIIENVNKYSNYSVNSKYLNNINISLADFVTYCSHDNYYEEPFGTRYYQAPEIILMGKYSIMILLTCYIFIFILECLSKNK